MQWMMVAIIFRLRSEYSFTGWPISIFGFYLHIVEYTHGKIVRILLNVKSKEFFSNSCYIIRLENTDMMYPPFQGAEHLSS